MWDALGLVGILVFFAGMHLIWQARDEVWFWLGEYVVLLTTVLRRMSDDPQLPATGPLVLRSENRENRDIVRLVAGAFLAFFVAPLLFSLGLAL